MAIAKIHAIQATVNKAVNYICNPEKTDEGILISSFGCSPQTSAFDFKFALSKTSQSFPNKAFHLIQAFMSGEVSYDEVIKIADSYNDFLNLICAKGYEIKGELFVRGSIKSLGMEYTKEQIKERLSTTNLP